jgi:tetratricopeptide (TPR) repeat protein
MKAQEEIKARLEVAQLYEEMGQLPKASRYYLAAAEIALKGKLFDRGRELLHKVLELDPDNTQAKTYLQKLDKHLESLGQAPPRSATGPSVSQPTAAAGSGGVTVPVPSLYLRSEQISAILSQVSSAPNPKFFPFTPLPKIDAHAVEEKNKRIEAAKEAERAKERTAVESAFGNRSRDGFTQSGLTSGFLDQAQRSGSRRRKKEEESTETTADEAPTEGRRRGRRGANQDLRDSISKRLRGG